MQPLKMQVYLAPMSIYFYLLKIITSGICHMITIYLLKMSGIILGNYQDVLFHLRPLFGAEFLERQNIIHDPLIQQ